METPSSFALTNAVNPETARPLGFGRYKFLTQPLDDLAPRVVLMKGAQVGATVLAILRTLWFVARRRAPTLYLFPTHRSALRFSRGRLAVLLERSAELRRLFFRQRNTAHLRADGVNLYCHGARSRTELLSMPIQNLIIDERDELFQSDPYGRQPWSALELARQRLAGQMESWEVNLSTPTLPSCGIAADYAQTDQHVYVVRCPKCGQCDALRWPDCLAWSEAGDEAVPPSFRCCICKGLWNEPERLAAIEQGTWTPERPGERRRGYHLPQLLSPALSARKLTDAWRAAQGNPAALQIFHNSILGLPYVASGARLEREHLEAALKRGGYAMPRQSDRPCVLGADVGPTWLHAVVLEIGGAVQRVVWIEKLSGWKALADLLGRYGVVGFVIDAQPETHAARQFLASHPQGWLCYYRGGEGFDADAGTKTVKASRTDSLDDLFLRFRQGRLALPSDTPAEFIQQMESLVRLVRADRCGQARAEYVEAGGPDHYAHALNYALLAAALAPRPASWRVTRPAAGDVAWG